jgi:hypothetical protein
MTPAAIVLGQAGADFDRHGVIPVHFAALLQKFQGAETAFAANDPVMLPDRSRQGVGFDPRSRSAQALDLSRSPVLGVYGGINGNFVLVAGRSRWQADGV